MLRLPHYNLPHQTLMQSMTGTRMRGSSDRLLCPVGRAVGMPSDLINCATQPSLIPVNGRYAGSKQASENDEAPNMFACDQKDPACFTCTNLLPSSEYLNCWTASTCFRTV